MDDPAANRLLEILSLARQSIELLDQAVGRIAKLKPTERELFREYLLPPRTHQRMELDKLGKRVDPVGSRVSYALRSPR